MGRWAILFSDKPIQNLQNITWEMSMLWPNLNQKTSLPKKQQPRPSGHHLPLLYWCCRNRLSAASKCPSGHASGASFRVTKLLEITVDGPPVMLRGINILRSVWQQDIEVAIYLGPKSWSCQLVVPIIPIRLCSSLRLAIRGPQTTYIHPNTKRWLVPQSEPIGLRVFPHF